MANVKVFFLPQKAKTSMPRIHFGGIKWDPTSVQHKTNAMPPGGINHCQDLLYIYPKTHLTGWNIFDFSETAERNSTKLDRKTDLKVLYQICSKGDTLPYETQSMTVHK